MGGRYARWARAAVLAAYDVDLGAVESAATEQLRAENEARLLTVDVERLRGVLAHLAEWPGTGRNVEAVRQAARNALRE
jgi:hypothetical protein